MRSSSVDMRAHSWKVRGAGALFALGLCSQAFAQITMTLNLRTPMPAQISAWERDRTIVQLIVTNASRSTIADTRIAFTVRDLESGKIVARSNDAHPGVPRLTIPAGTTLVRNGPDVVNGDAVSVESGVKAFVTTTNSLPEGTYEFCVQLLEESGIPLTALPACRTFTILLADPPTLLSPMNKDTLATGQLPMFTWTPVFLAPGMQAAYRLLLAPLYEGQHVRQALEGNPPLLETIVAGTTYLYLPSNPAFALYPGAKGFVWQVQALDPDGNPATRGAGKSEIFHFFPATPAPQMKVLSGGMPLGFQCGCNASTPSSALVKTGYTLSPGTVVTIGKFQMTVTSITDQPDIAGMSSGEGTIPLPMVSSGLVRVRVLFTGLQLNDANQVVGGTATARVQPSVGFLPKGDAPSFSSVPLAISDVQNLKGYFAQYPGQLLSAATSSATAAGFDLPLGIDQSIGGKKVVVAIVGMTFTPVNAVCDAAVALDIPDGTPGTIALGAKSVCIEPQGICGQGTLLLEKDTELSLGNSTLTLKGFKGTASASDSGTYVVFDKGGFKHLRIQAEYGLPTSLVARADNGGEVRALLSASAVSWSDWLGELSLPPFIISGMKEFSFHPTKAFYDHSDLMNPSLIPGEYTAGVGSLWHGVFVPALAMNLPPIFRKNNSVAPLSAGIANLIIDGQGVSCMAEAKNVLPLKDGDLGGWYLSVDSLRLQFVKNSLAQGGIFGRVILPLCGDDPANENAQLAYSTTVSVAPGEGLKLQFLLKPKNDLDVPLWVAKLSLKSTSHLEATYENGAVYAAATLNGGLSIDAKIGSLPKVNFQAMAFEGMKLETKAPYFSVQSFTAGVSSPQKLLGAFPVQLEAPPKIVVNGTTVGLGFQTSIVLADITTIPKAQFGFEILGNLGFTSSKRPSWKYTGLKPTSIGIQGNIGPVYVSGNVAFVQNSQFGDAIEGDVQANMLAGFDGFAAHILFGKSTFSYWYVDARYMFSPRIPIGQLPLYISGFGGGAYYNLSQQPLPSPADLAKKATFTTTGAYLPSKGSFGFKAGILLETASQALFEAQGFLTVEMTSGSLGIKSVSISGQAGLINPVPHDVTKSVVTGGMNLLYDVAHHLFDGQAAVSVKTPGSVLTGTGTLHLKVDADKGKWFFKLGEPNNRVKLDLAGLVTVGGYLMTGNEIPAAPEPPSQLTGSGKPWHSGRAYAGTNSAAGFAFGASFEYHPKDLKFLIFYLSFGAGLGFDIALTHNTQPACEGSTSIPGIHGWYARGDLWAYGHFDAGVEVDVWFFEGKVSAISAELKTVFFFGAPNPTWFEGWLYGHYSVLSGLVSGNMSFKVKIAPKGTCKPPASNPLGGIPLIADVGPVGGGVSTLVKPQALFTFPVGKQFEFTQTNDNGSTTVRVFRIVLTTFDVIRVDTKAKVTALNFNAGLKYNDDNRLVTLYKNTSFEPQTKYSITVSVKAQELKKGVFKDCIVGNNQVVQETKTAEFKTGDCVKTLDDGGFVLSTCPLDRQRFFLQKEQTKGYIVLSEFSPCLMGNPLYDLKVLLIAYGPKRTIYERDIKVAGTMLMYDMPPLPPETIVEVRIVQRPKSHVVKAGKVITTVVSTTYSAEGGKSTVDVATGKIAQGALADDDLLLHRSFFRTSRYNTLKEKLASSSLSANAQKEKSTSSTWAGWAQTWVDVTSEKFSGSYTIAEGFDVYDVSGKVVSTVTAETGNTTVSDEYQRPLVYLREVDTKNPWYTKVVRPFYQNATLAYGAVLPSRSLSDWYAKGGTPPIGPIRLKPKNVRPKLSDIEIVAAMLYSQP